MRLFYTFLVFSVLCTPLFLAAQNFNHEKIAKKLAEEMAKSPNDFHSVNLVLAEQVDLDALDAELSAQRALPNVRSNAVITALKTKAAETQEALLTKIKDSSSSKPSSVASFWLGNLIFAELKNDLIAELSNRTDVAWIGLNGQIEMEAVEVKPAPPSFEPNGHEKGLTVIGAPEMWAMGYTGYGQKALTNDTGVDPTRPALNTSFRGNTSPLNQSFFQYDNNNQSQIQNLDAFDCQYHGTHVTGTILGLDRLNNDTIGVAFNGQWMGAASLNVCGGNTQNLIAAFQWAIDPDGNPATSDDMADVVNNSWYDPSINGEDCMSAYLAVEQAMEAAGIAVVFSAGNAGPGASTITAPHNINISLVNSFTVGALNGNTTSLPIADFSSRGPSICPAVDSSLVIKPEVSAPGVDVRSCLPVEGYGLLSGTSMASPHVAGAIMLLKEAFPYLTGKDFKLALYFTAVDLGQPGEDNVFGMGLINLPAAFDYLVAQGNVPVSPFVDNDVFVVDLQVPSITCESEVSPMTLTVENGGITPLTSFKVKYEAGSTSNTITWTGNLAQKERTQIQLPSLAGVAPGNYRLRISLLNPNNVPDERPLNNYYERNLQVLSRERLEVQTEGATTACEGASVLLRAEYDGPGVALVKWYDEPFGGTVVGEGTAFATPPLAQADTFYAEATYIIPAGLEDKNTAPNDVLDEEEQGLYFDAERPFKLNSITVFANETGLRQFVLLNENGEELLQTVKNINQTGKVVVNLNWDVPAMDNLRIIKNGGKGLYSNTSDVTYPIEQPGLVKINGATDGSDHIYYYFYDWKIEISEICERTKIIVPVGAAGSSPGASFSASADSVDLTDNHPIQFTNTSTDNVASFDWNFGDGTGSTQENPSHTFNEVGIYIISLAINSLDGCSAFALDTIEVTENGLSILDPGPTLEEDVTIYPNPASETVQVQFDLTNAKKVILQVSDLTGKVVRSKSFFASQKDLVKLDIADLATGVYFLSVKMEGNNSVWKVVKI